MGGRGAGVIINVDGGRGVMDAGDGKWLSIVADFNPNAGHREIDPNQSMHDFARVSGEKYSNEKEVLVLMNNEGYITHAAEGENGRISLSPNMREDASGNIVSHYHNRLQRTDKEREEIDNDERLYQGLISAQARFKKAHDEIAQMDERRKELLKDSRKNTIFALDIRTAMDDTAYNNYLRRRDIPEKDKQKVIALRRELDALDTDGATYRNAYRRKERAARDFQEKADAYEGVVKSGRASRYSKPEDLKMPRQKEQKQDETGFIGGCFSLADVNSSLLAPDIPAFGASCDEGTYVMHPRKNADISNAQKELTQLWSSSEFQTKLRVIDRKAGNEGASKGWDKQKRRAISFNRQMAAFWEAEKEILERNGISASFIANPDYKPIYTED